MKKTKPAKTSPARNKTPEAAFHEPADFLTDPSHGKPPDASPRPVSKESLGGRIHQAREMRALTLQDLASRTGISLETLERIESNKIIPPLGELIKLGKALEMKMGYFISPGVEKLMAVVHSDKRPVVSRHGKKRSEQYGYFF